MPPLPPPRPRRLIAISTKMYFDLPTTLSYLHALLHLDPLAFNARIDLAILPDFLTLHPASSILSPSSILLGAQDTHWEDSGAYTGDVSPLVLSQLGVRIVEMGHAERRKAYGEGDGDVAKKAKAVAGKGMVPLVCIGERTRGGASVSAGVGMAVEECRGQVEAVMGAVGEESEVVFAYEPVWAIGAEEPAGADHVVNVVGGLRKLVEGRKGLVRFLYGGSAGPGTWEGIKGGVDGLFLGRFAHDVHNLKKVIEEVGGS